ncbi:MAG: hypothetical protein WB817_04875 [Terriglobales bacterium]
MTRVMESSTQNLQETAASQAPVAESVRALLAGLIDYAGLFPPASLPMADAVAGYDSYLRGPYRWMLGRFIVPVARLSEFQIAASRLPDTKTVTAEPWKLSVLPGADLQVDRTVIRDFNDQSAAISSNARIESLEIKIANAGEIARLSELTPIELETYFEIPLTVDVAECLAAIARCGRRAKMRAGGETTDKFPAPENVVEFIRLCALSRAPFKATAGLHHPLRSSHRLTYQPDSPSGIMHGFLNIFLVAEFLRAGMDGRLAVELLQEQSAEAFDFSGDGIRWRGHRLSVNEISATRQDFAISFGSCSFTEPVADLQSLHLL